MPRSRVCGTAIFGAWPDVRGRRELPEPCLAEAAKSVMRHGPEDGLRIRMSDVLARQRPVPIIFGILFAPSRTAQPHLARTLWEISLRPSGCAGSSAFFPHHAIRGLFAGQIGAR